MQLHLEARPGVLIRVALLLQLVRLEKFTLPEDSQLVRLHTMRQRYLAAGWEATSVTPPDAVVLAALLRPLCAPSNRSRSVITPPLRSTIASRAWPRSMAP